MSETLTRSLNPLLHLTSPAQLPVPQSMDKAVTLKLVTSWRSDMVFTGSGERRLMISARMAVAPENTRILLCRTAESWLSVPALEAQLYVLTHEFQQTPSAEIRAVPERRSLLISFCISEANHAELVHQAAGQFALRYFLTFTAEIEGKHVLLAADRKYTASLDFYGPYQLLPGEPLMEVIY